MLFWSASCFPLWKVILGEWEGRERGEQVGRSGELWGCTENQREATARGMENSPDALEVHGADFDDDALLFVLEDPVALPAGHAADVEQLCAVDHVVV